MATNKKKRKIKLKPLDIIMLLLLVASLVAITFPFTANYIATYQQARVINQYNKKVSNASFSDKHLIDKWIKEHNNALRPMDQPDKHYELTPDPFRETEDHPDKDQRLEPADKHIEKRENLSSVMGDVIGVLDIPKIDVDLPIYSGTNAYQLQRGAGLVKGTSVPFSGHGLHSVIAGHRGLPSAEMFRYLDKLTYNDYFFVSSNGRKFAYKVDQIKVVSPQEAVKFKIDPKKNYATLMTCTPYMINTHRLLVRGHQVAMPEDAQERWPWWMKYLMIFLAVVILALIRYLYQKHRAKQLAKQSRPKVTVLQPNNPSISTK